MPGTLFDTAPDIIERLIALNVTAPTTRTEIWERSGKDADAMPAERIMDAGISRSSAE